MRGQCPLLGSYELKLNGRNGVVRWHAALRSIFSEAAGSFQDNRSQLPTCDFGCLAVVWQHFAKFGQRSDFPIGACDLLLLGMQNAPRSALNEDGK